MILPAMEIVSPDAMLSVGHRLGASITEPMIIGLCGPLGAGKTLFVRGLARGIGVADDQPIQSPTFVLAREYVGSRSLIHCDVYRLHHFEEFAELGVLDVAAEEGSVVVIEWADRFDELLALCNFVIEFEHVDANRRRIRVKRGDQQRLLD